MIKSKTLMISTLLAGLMTMNTAMAAEHTVTAVGLVFQPLVIKIAPGDTVQWTKMSTHNVEMMDGLIPEGTEAFTSPMSQDVSHTFEKEGIYVYQCTPHIGAGMGGAVIVGEPTNLDTIKSQDVSGGLGRVVDKAVKEAEAM
ncbi:plastocyanin/azurin family copper-binding protein [Methylophaga sp. OBS4]|uniref:plastocyanin/azurin family copper-binding protein n=1 Tax=Methylophaga sp. OBS4 TaxID=2991935 RepID=UPI002257E055|nr:plastocyanin/azurin family copper-binding protein [Methylophaga sp. OBS4]MCX4187705.1 plastocyanin/azurin family copper-binding protein [Methylophaga sp. OBS4]